MTDSDDTTALRLPAEGVNARTLTEAERMHHLDRAIGIYDALWGGYIIESDPELQAQKEANLPAARPRMVAALRQHLAQSEKSILCLCPDTDREAGELDRELAMLARGKIPNELTSLHHIAGWQRLPIIAQSLGQRGRPVTKEVLQAPLARSGLTYLERGAKLGMLDMALTHLNRHGEQLTPADLLTPEGQPNGLLRHCILAKQLPALMQEDNWLGQHPAALRRVYRAVPPEARSGMTGYYPLLSRMEQQLQDSKQIGR